ncbi:MAG TPA: hypothetical protein VM389_01665, partial [Phycisphaerae bacterium]|nr:hypothetical protein [Phycisphaerae bacterium]
MAKPAVRFDENGLDALILGGQDLLASGQATVERVTLADRYWNPNELDHEKQLLVPEDKDPYSGYSVKRRKGSVKAQRRSFDAKSRTLRLTYEWGTVEVACRPAAGRLDLDVKVTNTSAGALDSIVLDLLKLRLPGEVKVSAVSTMPRWARSQCNVGAPRVIHATFAGGSAVFCSEQPGRPLAQNVQPMGRDEKTGATLVALRVAAGGGGEVYDGVWNARPIAAGKTDRYALSLRFGAADADPFGLAAEVYRQFGRALPMRLRWADRRPIAMVHVASGHAKTPGNPRAWCHAAAVGKEFDARTPKGREEFKQSLLRGADRILRTCAQMGVQGVVVWNVEGEEHLKAVYYGEPRLVPHIAPEMDAAADEFFRKLREGGLRVGLCIRPLIYFANNAQDQHGPWKDLVALHNRNFVQEIPEFYRDLYAPAEMQSPLARLDAKISYAKKRWGCTLFYVDTNSFWRPRDRSKDEGAWETRMFPAEVFAELCKRHPDVLIIPEHENLQYYGSTAPLQVPPGWGRTTG